MRHQLVLISLLLCAVVPADAQVSVAIGLPNIRIGINLPMYPQLVRVPGYPVYYAPDEDWNYFFYDGMYWVYQDDYWYASSWYNGPWDLIEPDFVPLFVLRVPVRYYRRPPMYFRGWQSDRPPHWGDHWGNEWSQRRSGWDHWNRNSAPKPAPLPTYQRQYSGDRYPHADQQPVLRNQNYQYQPRDPLVVQHERTQRTQPAPGASESRQDRQERNAAPRMNERAQPSQPTRQNTPASPRDAAPLPDRSNRPQSAPVHTEVAPQKREAPRDQPRQQEQRTEQRQQSAPAARGPDWAPPSNGAPQQSKREQNPGRDSDRENDRNNDDRGRGHK